MSLGSLQHDGLLTFKFDSDANDWDVNLYSQLVQVLSGAVVSKDAKSILECVLCLCGYSLI